MSKYTYPVLRVILISKDAANTQNLMRKKSLGGQNLEKVYKSFMKMSHLSYYRRLVWGMFTKLAISSCSV